MSKPVVVGVLSPEFGDCGFCTPVFKIDSEFYIQKWIEESCSVSYIPILENINSLIEYQPDVEIDASRLIYAYLNIDGEFFVGFHEYIKEYLLSSVIPNLRQLPFAKIEALGFVGKNYSIEMTCAAIEAGRSLYGSDSHLSSIFVKNYLECLDVATDSTPLCESGSVFSNTDKSVFRFIKIRFSNFELDFSREIVDSLGSDFYDMSDILRRSEKSNNYIKSGNIDSSIRTMYYLVGLTNKFPDDSSVRFYCRMVYGFLVWVKHCRINDRINSVVNASPTEQFYNEMKNPEGEFWSHFAGYLDSSSSEVLINLACFLTLYTTRVESRLLSTNTLVFGMVESMNPKLEIMTVCINRERKIFIRKSKEKDGLVLWAGADIYGTTTQGAVVAVSVRGESDQQGSRRGIDFVGSMHDTFFPLIDSNSKKHISLYLGASNCYLVSVCRGYDKTMLLIGSDLKQQLESLMGVARMIITTSGELSREQALGNIRFFHSSIRHFVNDCFSALIVDYIGESTVHVRIPCSDLGQVDERKVKTFFQLAKKIIRGYEFSISYGSSTAESQEIPAGYYSNSEEHESFQSVYKIFKTVTKSNAFSLLREASA